MSRRKLYQLSLFLFLGVFSPLSGQIDTVYVCNKGESAQLKAPDGYYAYQWSPLIGIDNPTIARPKAKVFTNQMYISKIITEVSGDNLITNPNFDEGDEGFESDYIFVNSIFIQGTYGISESAADLNATYFVGCPDPNNSGGKMLVVDGAPEPNLNVWCQTVEVFPSTQYAFSVWLASVNTNNPAELQFSINGEPLGQVFKAGYDVCEWRRFYEVWNAEDAIEAEICIVNQNIRPDGNDFVLDDFEFIELDSIIYDTTVVIIEALAKAKDRLVFFPEIFSPNDDGFNDTFRPFFGKGVVSIQEFRVFDRWGGMVHSKTEFSPLDETIAWDGCINGEPANPGVYAYFAKVRYADLQTKVTKGEVRLVR